MSLAESADGPRGQETPMDNEVSRRDFLKASMAVGAGLAAPAAGLATLPSTPASTLLKKGLVIYMLPERLSYRDRFQVARDAGFDCLEAQTVTDPREAEAIKKAAEDTGIKIHSVMNMAHWEFPLSSADPAVVAKGMEGMQTSLHNAKLWGAETVLLVPAVVNPQTRYADAWRRSQANIHQLIPLAAELKVIIAVEEVWNKFLLSPLEFARYVDEFKSPWVRAYLDVGNMVLFGYPQDWIRTLGERIVRVHLKDFKVKSKGFSPFVAEFVNLGDGDIDWPAVRKAFSEIGYAGPFTCELEPGDEAYLRDLSARVERLLLA
jgi:hexulose-6-phosphate isomerase